MIDYCKNKIKTLENHKERNRTIFIKGGGELISAMKQF